VVDNMSTDGSREALAREFPSVKVIESRERLGFAAANNLALPKAKGEFVLLLNPDTEVLDRAIEKSVAFMEAHPKIGILGCRLLFPDGSVQPSVRGFPSVLFMFLEATFLYLLLPKNRVVRKTGIVHFDYGRPSEVDWVIGAYFLIRRSVIEKIGLLDEQFWIYGEEVDYCQTAREAGFETWYFPDARVMHYYRGMTVFTLKLAVYLYIGHKLYVEKHYTGIEAFFIKYFKYLGAALRMLVYPVVGLLTLNMRLFPKAYYYAVALYKVLTKRVTYIHGHTGKVKPWSRFL
jgi:hypothetical protein